MSPGVVAAIHLAGERGETCGALRHKFHHVHVSGLQDAAASCKPDA